MKAAALLLLIAAASSFLPGALRGFLGGSEAAWAYVAYGMEAACLWAVAFGAILSLNLSAIHKTLPLVVCAWAMLEALERPVCRLMLPMDRAPKLEPGQNLCDVATGLPLSWAGFLAALLIACLAQEMMRCRK